MDISNKINRQTRQERKEKKEKEGKGKERNMRGVAVATGAIK